MPEDESPLAYAPISVLCPECGDIIEVRDVAALLLALHMAHQCSVRGLFGLDVEK